MYVCVCVHVLCVPTVSVCKREVCQAPLCVTGVIDSNGPIPVSSSALRCETCARCQRTVRAQMTTQPLAHIHAQRHTLQCELYV